MRSRLCSNCTSRRDILRKIYGDAMVMRLYRGCGCEMDNGEEGDDDDNDYESMGQDTSCRWWMMAADLKW